LITRKLRAVGAILVLGLLVAQRATASEADSTARLARLEIDVVRAEDVSAIKKLQRAYGFYADRGLWDDLANLFADHAIANYPSGGFDGNASIRAMFTQNLGQGKQGLAEGRIYNHTILQPVVDLAPDGATATGRWRVLGMLGRFGGSATWADSLYRFDYVKQDGHWKIRSLVAYAGSGGGYEQGWVVPKPRPPGTPDTSPVRFNLAHPADRPWIDACEQDVSVCVVPFPYPNRGTLRQPARVAAIFDAAQATDLLRRVQRLEDEQSVQNLQNAYGYYLDRGLWKQLADLFAPDGTREVGQAGVYVGRHRIRQSLQLTGPQGLRDGQLNDHLQFEPIIDVAPDGRTAQGRIFELAFVGGGGQPGRIVQNVQENGYVRRNGTWMIQSAHHYTILVTDYDLGWAKSALPARGPSPTLAPDRPATVVYDVYPKVYTPPLHFDNPSTRNETHDSGVTAAPLADRQIAAAQRQVQRVLDYNEIENLQSAYGYYAEKSLWSDIAGLFTDDGILEIDDTQRAGRVRILEYLNSTGPEGPVKGVLDSQLQLQPVIHVSADGRTARMRSRLLQLTRDAQGQPMWGSGIYENELVKVDGVWKFKRLHLYRTWKVNYKGGWAAHEVSGSGGGQLFPNRFTPPFHYSRP
jgi:hypothetical protein